VTGHTDLGSASPDLAWVADVLWRESGVVGVSLGDAPAWAQTLEAYAVVPSATRPRLLLPIERVPAFGAARAGARLRGWRMRAERAAVAALARGGLVRVVFRDRLTVFGEAGATAARRGLVAELTDVLGERVWLAVNVRPPTPYRKPVIQAVARDGRVLAYAKVAWSELTDRNVQAEGRALQAIQSCERVAAPRVLGETRWRGHTVLVTAPMPRGLRRFGTTRPPSVGVTRDVAGIRGLEESAYSASAVRARLRARLERVRTVDALPAVAAAVSEVLDALDTAGHVDIVGASWHGDWSPWNLAIGGDRVWAWDWEYSRGDVPLGLDIPHFHLQVGFIARRRSYAASFADAHDAAGGDLSELGWDERGRALLRGVHGAEVALRYLEAEANGARANPRFVAEAVPALRAEADRAAR
jgi:hypothetical protein